MIGANSVATAVKVKDKGKFEPDMYAITLDANPLGEQPTKITPAATSGGRLKAQVSPTPTNGIIVNWQIIPTKTPFGIFITPTKSFILMAVPIPNIINMSKGTISFFKLNHPISVNKAGQYKDAETAANIKIVQVNPFSDEIP